MTKKSTSTRQASSHLALFERDIELLDILANKVRVVTLNQVARTWWPSLLVPRRAALRRLSELERAGYIVLFTAIAHPEIELPCPILSWMPGAPPPDFGAASHRLKSRWSQPPREIRCVYASSKTGCWFGGHGGRRPRESEETHDIHLAQLYFRLRLHDPQEAKYWTSEESVRAARTNRNQKLPDAIIDNPKERRVIEFGGAYSKAKLQAFHQYCSQELKLPYEVW